MLTVQFFLRMITVQKARIVYSRIGDVFRNNYIKNAPISYCGSHTVGNRHWVGIQYVLYNFSCHYVGYEIHHMLCIYFLH